MSQSESQSQKMHADEVDIDVPLVRQLLQDQMPHLVDRPIEQFPSTGTVNAIFRLGDDLCVRLPRRKPDEGDLLHEVEWLPKLAPQLSLAVPEPVALGTAAHGYPCAWAVYRWLDGDTFALDRIDDEATAATDLAAVVAELRQIDTTDAPRTGRRPLPELDTVTREAITAAADVLDAPAVTAAWDLAVSAPTWDGTAPVWRHGDLLPPNLLVEDGRLHAILDFGGAGVGDPAADVVPAWSVFGTDGRHVFRQALDVDDALWARARGYALHQALLIIPYYATTNPAFVTMAQRTVGEVLLDRP